jgi:CheY-like chemotaxis protein
MNKTTLAGLKVLCVDDCESALFLVSSVLKRNGAQVTACSSAQEALTQIRAKKFDVIVSDLSMPDMDGYDLAHQLRAGEMAEADGDAVTAGTLQEFELQQATAGKKPR